MAEKLTYEQLEAKAAFLAQQVHQLQDALLDYQIRAGDISLKEQGE